MKTKSLFALWGGLYILCAGLGFIPEPEGTVRTVLSVISLLFFLPPAMLVYRAARQQNAAGLKLMCCLSGLSLLLTLVLLMGNFLTALGSQGLGTVLYYMLVIISTPMICSGYWALSLFLWACLLMVSLRELRRLRHNNMM